MKTLQFFFDTRVECSAPVIEHQFVLRCCPRPGEGQQVVRCRTVMEPDVPLFEQRDGFGNVVLWGTVLAPHTALHYRTEGVVRVDAAQSAAPAPNPAYRYPGPRTRPGPELRARTAAWNLDGLAPPELCRRLCGAVHDAMRYKPGTTGVRTTAEQALAQGCGVCQDAAQIFAAAARLHGLPVRYCVGLTVGEGATHAWPEVYYDGAWHGFDPTRGRLTDESYLRLAVGRDAADCPVESGVFKGLCDQTQTVFMKVEEIS